jgi:hypothetical protein
MPMIFTGHDLDVDARNDLFIGHQTPPPGSGAGCFGGLIVLVFSASIPGAIGKCMAG